MTRIIDQTTELPPSREVSTTESAKMPRSESERQSAPRERFDFGSAQSKLSVFNTDPNYHYHWINDTPGRVQQAIAGGYEFVSAESVQLVPGVLPTNSDSGDRVSAIVGTGEDNGPLRAYLMRIPLEWYEEKLARQQQRVDLADRAIRQGKTTGQEGSNFYIPEGGIKMSNKLGN